MQFTNGYATVPEMTEKEYGTAHIFCLGGQVGIGVGALQKKILKSRDTTYDDYEGTITFIDCTNLRYSFSRREATNVCLSTTHKPAPDQVITSIKKRKHSDRIVISNGIEYFPLIAFSLDYDSWILGVAFSLYPTNMIVAKADISKDQKVILNEDLLYIDHYSSTYQTSSCPDDKECTFSCRYLNLITENSECPSDGKLECSVYGPHRIHHSQVSEVILQKIKARQKSDKVLIKVPPYTNGHEPSVVQDTDPNVKPKKVTQVFCSNGTTTVPVSPKPITPDNKYAVVYSDMDGVNGNNSKVRVAHLESTKMKEMIDHMHEQEQFQSDTGEIRITHSEFNRLLDEYSGGNCTDMDSHSIPRKGIAFEIKNENGIVKERVLPHNREGVLLAVLGCDDTEEFVMVSELIDYMLLVTYKTRATFSSNRDVAGCLGMNIYSGINSSGRPRPTPRKGPSSILTSERWNEQQNPTFLPILLYIMDKLSAHSNEISKAIDPVFDTFQRRIFSEGGTREKIDCNNDPGLRFNQLRIMTGPDDKTRGFCNGSHTDENDVHKRLCQAIGRKILEDDLDKCEQILKDRCSSEETRQKAIESLNAILHLFRLGGGNEEGNDLSWAFMACCGYLVNYSGPKNRKLCAHFIYNDIRTAVAFRFKQLCFNFWNSRRNHQTAFPYTVDKDYVYIYDKNLSIHAWGCGKSSNRLWLENFDPGIYIGGRLSEDRLIQLVVQNDIVQAALQNTTLTQTRIDRWISRNEEESEVI